MDWLLKKLMLGAALLTGAACGQSPQQVYVGTTVPEESTTTSAEPSPTTTAAEATTTTEPAPEPVATTVPYVAPVTTRRAPVTTVYEPPSPQSRTVEPAGDVWWQLALCESGGSNVDTGNGYSGYFQFLDSTWRSVGYSGRAVDYSYETQVAGAQTLQARSGWGQWPACSRMLGLR